MCGRLVAMNVSHRVMPAAMWHHVGMDDERRKRLRSLGRAYRRAMEAEKAAREALAAEVVAALEANEPVGEIAREIGFDREWVRRARIARTRRQETAAG